MANNTVTVPTPWMSAVFSAFAKFDWAEIGKAVEQKSLSGGITTAEHIAEALAGAFASTGNPVAIAVEAALPAAESLGGVVLNMLPALHKAGVVQATAPKAPTA